MTLYQNFIGIDIGKFTFVTNVHGQKLTNTFDNTMQGLKAFIRKHKQDLSDSLTVLETTGGYEFLALKILLAKGYAVHRANTRKVKNFIRSFGNDFKTDALDTRPWPSMAKNALISLTSTSFLLKNKNCSMTW